MTLENKPRSKEEREADAIMFGTTEAEVEGVDFSEADEFGRKLEKPGILGKSGLEKGDEGESGD